MELDLADKCIVYTLLTAIKDIITVKNFNTSKTIFMTFTMPKIIAIESHSTKCLGNEYCDSDCFKLNCVYKNKYLGIFMMKIWNWKHKKIKKSFYVFIKLNLSTIIH